MKDVLLTVAQGLGDFVKALGFAGFFLCLAALVLLVLAMRFLDFTVSTLGRTHREWRRLPPWLRQSLLIVAAFVFLPTIWKLIPWRSALLAVVCAGLVVLSAGGVFYGNRYGVHDSPWAAWSYHLRVTAKRPRFNKAVDNGTGKRNAKATRVRLTDTGDESVVLPPDGMSATELADQVNEGKLQSALARSFGIANVQATTAIPQADGTVLLRMERQVAQDDPLFTTTQHWPGMESR